MSLDAVAADRFYTAAFGWGVVPMIYLAHGDVDDGASTAARLGGRVVVPPRDTPTGRPAAVTDPSGAVSRC